MTSTQNYIVKELQRYKSYWQYLLGKKVHLDYKENEIDVIIALPRDDGIRVDRKNITNYMLNPNDIKKKRRVWNKIRRVEYWLRQLTKRQREAVFWRYINHDFEQCNSVECLGLKYKTLSYREISKRMGLNEKTVWVYVQYGLEKIGDFVERGKEE